MESVVSVPRLDSAPLPWGLWAHVPSVSMCIGPEVRLTVGPSPQKFILFRLIPAGCSLLAAAMPELILQMRLLSTRCSFRMQDPVPRSTFTTLLGGRVTNVATAPL